MLEYYLLCLNINNILKILNKKIKEEKNDEIINSHESIIEEFEDVL